MNCIGLGCIELHSLPLCLIDSTLCLTLFCLSSIAQWSIGLLDEEMLDVSPASSSESLLAWMLFVCSSMICATRSWSARSNRDTHIIHRNARVLVRVGSGLLIEKRAFIAAQPERFGVSFAFLFPLFPPSPPSFFFSFSMCIHSCLCAPVDRVCRMVVCSVIAASFLCSCLFSASRSMGGGASSSLETPFSSSK